MDNLDKYKEFITEMKIINDKEEPEYYFTKDETQQLIHNDVLPFNITLKNKAVCLVTKYRISIYKNKIDHFLYRIREVSKAFNPIIYEKTATNLRDCLYDLDEYMWERTIKDRKSEELERKIKLGLIEKPKKEKPQIFSYKSFTGKGHI